MTAPSPEQVAEWRKDFAKAFPARPLSASHQAVTDNDYVFAGYIRARTEQAAEIASLKAQIAELSPLANRTTQQTLDAWVWQSWQAAEAYGRKEGLEDALAIVQNENKVGDIEFEIKELLK